MLLQYPCAMQKKNHYWQPEENYFRYVVTVAIVFFTFTEIISAAPTFDNSLPQSQAGEIAEYFSEINGCYYNFQRYEEGDRIVTNEPCLNCTCHNRMLMCYLRVCPFTKAIGQDCTIEKKPDQCCPIITCPEVPVKLLTSSTTSSPAPITSTTEIGFRDNYGCTINNAFYADGAQVPSDVKKPCELCYCIRNHTACVMQECTLHVEGCKPVYQDGVCCPVRYECDYDNESSSTPRQENIGGLIKSTTTAAIVDCQYGDQIYSDGELIVTDKPCEHCYCMRGDIVCAVQDCGEPLRGKDCIPTTPPPEKCCPSSYACANETTTIDEITKLADLITTTEYQSQTKFSSFETTTRPKHSSTVLTNEQVYQKLGENTTPISTEKSPEKPSSKAPPKHPSEDIQLDNNSIDAEEHFSEGSNSLSTEKTTEKISSDENEDLVTTVSEQLADKTSTQLPAASKTPSDDLITLDPLNEFTTTESQSKVSLPVVNQVQDDSTKIPEKVFSSHQPENVEITSQTILEETTRYIENSKEPTEKFFSSTISETQENLTSSEKPVSTESIITEEKISEQTTPTFVDLKPEDLSTNKPSSEDQPDDNSSESNRFQSTTRQFDKSTLYVKEPETTKAPEETLQITTKTSKDETVLPIEVEKEQQTENINTVTHESTDSLLENITKIISSIQSTHQNPADQLTKIEITKSPIISSTETLSINKLESNSSVTENIAEISTIKEEIGTTSPSGIPGEGSCLVDGITYSNGSIIESYNPCHSKCVCLSSIPTCTLVTCAPPPNHPNCMPIQMKPESCCPVYICNNDDELPSVHVPPSHSQILPDEQELSNGFNNDEEITEHILDVSTETPEHKKQTEKVTEKIQSDNEIVEDIKPENVANEKFDNLTTLSNKPENEPTESPKPEYNNVENKISITTFPSKTTNPDTTTELSQTLLSEAQENTIYNSSPGYNNDNQNPINEIPEESTNKSNNEITQQIVISTIIPLTSLSSIIDTTEQNSDKTTHTDQSAENEIHNDISEITTENIVLNEASTNIQSQIITQDPLQKNYTVESSTNANLPIATESNSQENNLQSDSESSEQEHETENAAKITTENMFESNNVISSTTELKDQKYSTEIPSSTEHDSTVYLNDKIDINPTTLPSKTSEEQNDATEYVTSSSTENVEGYSPNSEGEIATTEPSLSDSQSTGTTSNYNPQSSILDIINELQNELTTKTYELFTNSEIPSTSENIKYELESTTTPKIKPENEEVAEITTTESTEYQNNNIAPETTPPVEEMHSVSNDYTSESHFSSLPTTEKFESDQHENTEKINNQEVSEEPYLPPTTTATPIDTTLINEEYNHSVETTESSSSNEPYHSSTVIKNEFDITTEHKIYNTEKPTEIPQLDTEEHASSPAFTVNANNDEENKVNEEPVKPVTILPETDDIPAITVLPSKSTYPVPLIPQNENQVTEYSIDDHSIGSSSLSPTSDETQTKISITNELPQHTETTAIPKEEIVSTDSPIPLKPETDTSENPLKQESPITTTTEKVQTIIPSQSTFSYIPPFSSTNSPIQHSTWTKKPSDEETSEQSYYPPGPMYPTGGGDAAIPEAGSEESEYEEDNSSFGPGTCRYGGKIYVSAQQIPRDDPCDFCFCFRSDIICLQQSCPPPIQGCRQEPISGFCCPRYECPVATALTLNLTSTTSTTTTSTTTTLPPHFPLEAYRGTARRAGCMIHGYFYKVGEDVAIASGPCLDCICGSDGRMKCDPKACSPEPFVRQLMRESISKR